MPDAPHPQGTLQACQVFCSYAHRDSGYREDLETHLRVFERTGLIQTWHDRRLLAGDDWRGEIDANLNAAHLIVLLVSPDFLASDYCYDVEMTRALERHRRKEARVVPIIVRPSQWQHSPLGELQVLPRDAKPISEWTNKDTAFNSVAAELRTIVLHLQASM